MEDLDNLIRRLEEIRNHLKWIKRAENGWESAGLKIDGIAERIDRAYNEVLKPDNVELLNKLGIPIPNKSNWRYFRNKEERI
jgi:hypothetical protein